MAQVEEEATSTNAKHGATPMPVAPEPMVPPADTEDDVADNHDDADISAVPTNTAEPTTAQPSDDDDDNVKKQKDGAEPYYRTDALEYKTFLERVSVRVAHRPCTYFWAALLLSLGIGMVGLTVGDFSVAVDNDGWYSRGTLIADREQQYWLVDHYRYELFVDETGALWDYLENERQTLPSYDDDDDSDRRLDMIPTDEEDSTFSPFSINDWNTLGSRWHSGMQFMQGKHRRSREETATSKSGEAALKTPTRKLPHVAAQDWLVRRLQAQESLGPLEGCDVNWYNSSEMFQATRLWPVYKNVRQDTISLWDGPALQEMCEFEAVTQQYLEQEQLCLECDSQGDENYKPCLQPYSPVLFARLTVENGLTMSCEELAQTWDASYLADIEQEMGSCVEAILLDYNPDQDGAILPENACPAYFFPNMLDEYYPERRDYISHSSAIYATRSGTVDDLYDGVDEFGYGSQYMETYYDTQYEDLSIIETDKQVLIDMALAVGSAGITLLAMVIHTRSPFLALVGLLQIVLAFPLAYFVYVFVARLKFFPFLNFIGIFVIFALGADVS